MEISKARVAADKVLAKGMHQSLARRPEADKKVYVRYPQHSANMIFGGDEEELRDRVAKKIQREAKRRVH